MPESSYTQSFLFGLTAGLRHILSRYEANSPETDLAVEFLVRESHGELSRQQAIARLWCGFAWDLALWMNAKHPEGQLRVDRLRILALCSEVAHLQSDLSRNAALLFESLAQKLELGADDMVAVEATALDALNKRRTNLVILCCNLSNWDYMPIWLISICELYSPVLGIYRSGSAEWHLARERFIEGFYDYDGIDRTIVIHALSEVVRYREYGSPLRNPFAFWEDDERRDLLVQAVDIASVDPKVTRRKMITRRMMKRLGEFADRLDLPEAAVQEVLDARAAEREPSSD